MKAQLLLYVFVVVALAGAAVLGLLGLLAMPAGIWIGIAIAVVLTVLALGFRGIHGGKRPID